MRNLFSRLSLGSILTPTVILAMVKSNAKNMARKPGEENKSSKVVGGIQYEEQQKKQV